MVVHGEDAAQEDSSTVEISVRDPSVHSLSFECELYLKNIKVRMFSEDDAQKAEMYHQIHIDEGLKQICPYLVSWIQSEVNAMDLLNIGPIDSANEARIDVVVSGVHYERDAQSDSQCPFEHSSLR